MNSKLKKQLKKAFDAPDSKRKKEFLSALNFPKATRADFIISQIGYIRKRVWVISCLLAVAVIFGLSLDADDIILNLVWMVSSVLPFLSLVSITEIARSMSYNMTELEMSCKYNFSEVVLSRLGILGGFNIAVFVLIILSFHGKVDFGIFRLGMYLLTPFLLSCSLSFFVLNRLRSREITYTCGSISCFVCIANVFITTQYNIFSSDKYLFFWSMALIILLIWTIREIIKFIKKMEELQWNLSLTD